MEKNNIRVIFCDEKYNPYSEIKPFFSYNNSSETIREQIEWDKTVKDKVWEKIVADKIQMQQSLLKLYNISYPQEREYNEANFASIYFKKLFGKNFVRFQNDNVNSALNYGYTLLLSKVNRLIINHGYLTQLGVHHNNKTNNYNLSCDFIEPFRPVVDKIVYNNKESCFDTFFKRKLQNVFYEKIYINDKKTGVGQSMDIYVKNKIDFANKKTNEFSTLRVV